MKKTINHAIADLFDEMAARLQGDAVPTRIRIGLTLPGSEHGEDELLRGAELALAQLTPTVQIIPIGTKSAPGLEAAIPAADLKAAHARMEELLQSGQLDAAVTMHYSFPIGVATVGRINTPAFGRSMYLASTTGASSTQRASAMLRNAVAAIAVAQACGNASPSIGILNLDGAQQVQRALAQLASNGYPIRFAQSGRADGGALMRGNDLLQGVPDIMLSDSLTGNILMKTFSAFSTGGSYEALGDGYGPGVGEGYAHIVHIVSRASGAPVVAGALRYAAACAAGGLPQRVAAQFALAQKAGLAAILAELNQSATNRADDAPLAPPAKAVAEEILGVDVLALDDAVSALWRRGIYAASGMGCTGPVILIAEEDKQTALAALRAEKYL